MKLLYGIFSCPIKKNQSHSLLKSIDCKYCFQKVGSGPGLAFMTFSDAMLLMDVSPLWAILFFTMLILLGIDSEFGTLEAAIGPLIDLKIFPKLRKEFLTLLVAVILFLFGISMVSAPGFYVFQMFDDYSVTIPLLVIALFQCIGVAWVYGNNR